MKFAIRRRIWSIAITALIVVVAGLAELQQLPALGFVNLGGSSLSAKHLTALAKLKLNDLLLGNTGIDDAAYAPLAGMETLRTLDMVNNPLTDKSVAELKKLTGLKKLDINSTKIGPAGIAKLQKALPECEIKWK